MAAAHDALWPMRSPEGGDDPGSMIAAHALSKRYGDLPVVDDVTFTCHRGSVTGFLGPNGAGKSTTLRMITGLTRPDQGHATVAGVPFVGLPNPSRVVGTLLDASAMHPGRSGRNTLAIAAHMADVPQQRVDQVLAQVGLSQAAAQRRVGTYSLGMRQRLGIAQTLIGNPQVLILDEPANGLDPEGIAWMRELLRDFADQGGTVLLSSHLLAEVEATVDRLIVIRAGRVVADGRLADLLSTPGLVARATDPAALVAALTRAAIPSTAKGDGMVSIDTTGGATAEQVASVAAQSGVLLVELRNADRAGLEQLFFALTSPSGAPADTQEMSR
jgi:ABC-2 type transport system ATP-binding protein